MNSLGRMYSEGLSSWTDCWRNWNPHSPQYQPTPTDDIRKIMYQAGQRSVVEYIKDKQEKN
ncbi:hypothetical protein S-CBP42_0002 [Synechococcus phage S-CBP42]|uniref:Uncharacterized protein n=1 Tax=Synechococcus phage S-CBP42 TaxID=461711 RepID=A0A096VKV1_9CAUD|nr:hypothetical protein AVU76_gp02 [Synechococcus phage S-CBP42]AGK86657.1 hypothetical protein S-CBP42_0002 [Synechococcus phage S-CBP42]